MVREQEIRVNDLECKIVSGGGDRGLGIWPQGQAGGEGEVKEKLMETFACQRTKKQTLEGTSIWVFKSPRRMAECEIKRKTVSKGSKSMSEPIVEMLFYSFSLPRPHLISRYPGCTE